MRHNVWFRDDSPFYWLLTWCEMAHVIQITKYFWKYPHLCILLACDAYLIFRRYLWLFDWIYLRSEPSIPKWTVLCCKSCNYFSRRPAKTGFGYSVTKRAAYCHDCDRKFSFSSFAWRNGLLFLLLFANLFLILGNLL